MFSFEIITLLSVLGLYLTSFLINISEFYGLINFIGPIIVSIILIISSINLLLNNKYFLWTPFLWFRVASAAFFGFGSIAHYFSNEDTRAAARYLIDFLETEILQVNIINLCSIIVVLFVSRVILSFSTSGLNEQNTIHNEDTTDVSSLVLIMYIFLFIGGYFRFFVQLPDKLNHDPEIVASGFIVQLSNIFIIGLFLLLYYALKYNRSVLPCVFVLIFVNVLMGLLLFEKTDVIITLIFCSLAILHHKLTMSRMVIIGSCFILIYITLAPFVLHGRSQLEELNGDFRIGSLQQRFEITLDYFGNEAQEYHDEDQAWLRRLSYAPMQAYVIDQYNQGVNGETLQGIFYTLIPRLLWPDKPILGNLGENLYFLIHGRGGVWVSPGIFAEAYWNYGWLGIPLLMIPFGFIIGFYSRYSLFIISRNKWLYLPVVLFGITISVAVSGWFVLSIIGPLIIAIYLHILLFILEKISRIFVVRRFV